MAKKVIDGFQGAGGGKKKKKVQPKPGGGGGGNAALPPMPAMPQTPTSIPRGKLTAQDKAFLDRQKSQLNKARKKGKQAATGQLASIHESVMGGIGKQSKKMRRENTRVLNQMDRLVQNEREWNRRQRQNVTDSAKATMLNTGPSGSPTSWMNAGYTDARARQARMAGRTGNKINKATQTALERQAQMGQRAMGDYRRTERTASRNSMSILDVLAAERASEDQRFITEMRFQIRQQRESQAFQLMMANLGFQQDVYKMKLQNRLEAEYLEWQHDAGYLMKPEEQAALDWKYKKKEATLSYRLAQRDADSKAAATWDTYNTALTDTITEANMLFSDPEKWQNIKDRANAKVHDGLAATQDDAIVSMFTERTLPEGVDPGVVGSVVRDMVESRKAAEISPEGNDGPLWAPNFDSVKEYILQADTDGSLASYAERKSGVLSKLHEDYSQISAAATIVDSARNAALTGGTAAEGEEGNPGFIDYIKGTAEDASIGGIVGAGIAGVGAGVAARIVGSHGDAVARAAGAVAESGIGQKALGAVRNAVDSTTPIDVGTIFDRVQKAAPAARATYRQAAQTGRLSPFGAGVNTFSIDDLRRFGAAARQRMGGLSMEELRRVGAGALDRGPAAFGTRIARSFGGSLMVGDEALAILRHTDEELYNDIVRLSDVRPATEDDATVEIGETYGGG